MAKETYHRNFVIGDEELAKINPWLDSLFDKQMEVLRKELGKSFDRQTKGGTRLYTGCTGGNLTYSFTPTSLGTVVKVKEALTGEELDLTDYDLW